MLIDLGDADLSVEITTVIVNYKNFAVIPEADNGI